MIAVPVPNATPLVRSAPATGTLLCGALAVQTLLHPANNCTVSAKHADQQLRPHVGPHATPMVNSECST